MKKIYIVGAGGFGRELLQWIKDINRAKPTWEIGGFLDDRPEALKGFGCDYNVVGSISDWRPSEDEEFALALANPLEKERVSGYMKAKGAVFASVIHPTAILTGFSCHGEGLVMFPYSKLSVNSRAGDFVTILSSGIGHDVEIGDYSTVSGACSILRNVKIGRRVFLAANAVIANGVTIGDDAYIGLGSIVIKDVQAGQKTFGSPARVLPS